MIEISKIQTSFTQYLIGKLYVLNTIFLVAQNSVFIIKKMGIGSLIGSGFFHLKYNYNK